ncbi:hypothetical protein FO519_009496, partial [Halicephalobus sp. NKZ332]
MSDVWKAALINDYGQDIEMKTDTMFNAIELFFHHQTPESYDDMKRICDQYQPYTILNNLGYKLKEKDSTYYKQLKLLGWKSQSANGLVKEIQGIMSKLVISYGICKGVEEKVIEGTPSHVAEIVNSTLDILLQQRKKAPNLLPPKSIEDHLENISEQFPKCDKNESEKNCTKKVSKFILDDLQRTFDYGKIWSIRVSKGSSCSGNLGRNSFEKRISDFNILVHFTNPVFVPPEIPVVEVKETLTAKANFSSSGDLLKNAFDGIEDICGNRSLCVVCDFQDAVISNGNIDKTEVEPCRSNNKLTVIMGEEKGQEEEYPYEDKIDFEGGLKWLTKFEENLRKLEQKIEEYKKQFPPKTTTTKSIKEDPELKIFANKIVEVVDEKLDEADEKLGEAKMIQMNASDFYIRAERFQQRKMEFAVVFILLTFYRTGTEIMDFIANTHETYGVYQDIFQNDVRPEINSVLLELKKEFDFTMNDVWKTALTSDYKQEIEIKTNALFTSIERFFHNSSVSFLDDVKEICADTQPWKIMANLKLKLEDEDSVYIRQLKLLGWKSKSANDIVKKIQGTLSKLVISYGFCKGFNEKDVKGTPSHVAEIVNSTLNTLLHQRKKVPNMLPPQSIEDHLEKISENFPKCDKDEDERNCTERVSKFILDDLQRTFDYGKVWSIRVSKSSSCSGTLGRNSFQTKISDFNILVHFTNPILAPLEIPEDEVNEKLNEKTSKIHFWESVCPIPWFDFWDSVTKNAFRRIENLCENRTLCVVCKSDNTVINNGNINMTDFNPCMTHRKLTVIIGGEEGEEEKYPYEDKIDFEEGLKWMKKIEVKLEKWKKMFYEYKKMLVPTTTMKSIKEDPELKAFVKETLNIIEERLDEIETAEMNASNFYRRAERLQQSNSMTPSFL